MATRQIARNSARVFAFVASALMLFGAVYFAVAFVGTLITFVWSAVLPVSLIAMITVLVLTLIMTQTYRRYPAPYMLPDATGELRGWLWSVAAVDIVLGIANHLATLHG